MRIALLLLALVITQAVNATDSAEFRRIQLIEVTCYTCHGPDNSGSKSIPALNNLTAEEITSLLLDYKYDKQIVTIMNRIAKSLTDKDIHLLSKQISSGE